MYVHGFRFCFTPLAGVLFAFPSRYWFTIGRQGIFSLGGGPSGFPRGFTCPVVLGYAGQRDQCDFAYRAFTFCGGSFQSLRLSPDLVTLRATPYQRPATPNGLAPIRFRLFPFRSPLLRESSFLSLPRGTEMFQFPRFAPSKTVTGLASSRVAPFGHLGIIACVPLPQAYRSLPRPSSPPCAQASPTCLHSLDYNNL